MKKKKKKIAWEFNDPSSDHKEDSPPKNTRPSHRWRVHLIRLLRIS